MPPARPRTLYRCPCCAKISPPKVFATAETNGYELDVMTVSFVGGGRAGRPKDDEGKLVEGGKGRGFQWSRRDLDTDERWDLARISTTVGARLLGEVVEDAAQSDDFEDVAAKALGHAQKQLKDLEERVAEARREHRRFLLDS